MSEIFLLSHFLSSVIDSKPGDDEDRLSPRPCDHFDLICGTSSGGLLAILFGRLRMNCSEAKDVYERLGRLMFAEEEGTGKIMVHLEDENRARLKEELEKIILDKAGSVDALMDPKVEDKDGYCYVSP